MHKEVIDYIEGVRKKLPNYFNSKDVYDIGSRDINGSAKTFFTKCNYVGFDLSEGKGVDVVLDWSKTVDLPQVDVVVCLEVLEHCRGWKRLLKNLVSHVKPGGLIIFTAAGINRPIHGTSDSNPGDSPDTNDYYRNISMLDIVSTINVEETFSVFEPSYLGTDIRFWGIKR